MNQGSDDGYAECCGRGAQRRPPLLRPGQAVQNDEGRVQQAYLDQVWTLTHFSPLSFFLKIIDLAGRQINDPSAG